MMIKELVKVATKLDLIGLTKEADFLDRIIEKLDGRVVTEDEMKKRYKEEQRYKEERAIKNMLSNDIKDDFGIDHETDTSLELDEDVQPLDDDEILNSFEYESSSQSDESPSFKGLRIEEVFENGPDSIFIVENHNHEMIDKFKSKPAAEAFIAGINKALASK